MIRRGEAVEDGSLAGQPGQFVSYYQRHASHRQLLPEGRDPRGEEVETCTILTTEANELMRPLHDRMPVILDASADALWLDPRSPADVLRSLFVPFASERMEAFPVNPFVHDRFTPVDGPAVGLLYVLLCRSISPPIRRLRLGLPIARCEVS